MIFPVLKENDLNGLRDEIVECPECKTPNLIELCKPEENLIYDFCMKCNYKKEKELK